MTTGSFAPFEHPIGPHTLPPTTTIFVVSSYRSGFTHEEVKDQSEQVQRVLRLENAAPREILAFRKSKAIEKFQKSVIDTGSAPVTSNMLTIAADRLLWLIYV